MNTNQPSKPLASASLIGKLSTHRFLSAAVAASALALSGSAAHAQLISDESFLTGAGGYTVGQKLTAAPIPSPTVAGYTGNWTVVDFGTQQPTATAASLVYGGAGYAAGVGGSIGVPAYTGGIAAGNSERMYRLLDSTTKVDSSTTGTLYLSFLYQSGQEHGATTFQMLDLYNTNTADANRTFTAGLTTNGGNTGSIYDFGVNEGYHNLSVAADTAVHLFVVKFDLSAVAASDSVTVWLDPTLGAGDPAGGFTVSGQNIAFDRLSISNYAAVGSNGGNSAAWDEIRFGGSFDAVTITAVPEPSFVAAAIGLFGVFMIIVRRRRGAVC